MGGRQIPSIMLGVRQGEIGVAATIADRMVSDGPPVAVLCNTPSVFAVQQSPLPKSYREHSRTTSVQHSLYASCAGPGGLRAPSHSPERTIFPPILNSMRLRRS